MLLNAEGIKFEYKREFTDDIKKAVIAFANTEGGEIWVGVDDSGTIVGIQNLDETIRQITNSIRDTIKPDISMHTKVDVKSIEGKQVILVEVQKGTACPYYLSGKGLRPEGVFVRQGSSTVPASESIILKMIKETGERFEDIRSLLQDLTFKQTEQYFKEEKLKFGTEQKRSLGIIRSDGSYSNLGLLLSDQCLHTIKAAVFEGTSKMVFKDRSEFSGSLLKQLEDTYRYLDQFNHTRATISGLKRIEQRNYPPDAIREALLNAVIHRDYSYSGSILVSIFNDRIELVSLGGLTKGITYNDLLLGVSVPRNIRLADIFYRLSLIEAYGTGVPKIMDYYKVYGIQPGIAVSDNAFKITLPNTNIISTEEDTDEFLSSDEQIVINHIFKEKDCTRSDIETSIGFSQTKSIRILNNLMRKGLIKKSGKGKQIRYHPS